MGSRWAIESDAKGKPVQILDLSQPDLLAERSIGKIATQIDLPSVKKLLLAASVSEGDAKIAQEAIQFIDDAGIRAVSESVIPKGWWNSVLWNNLSIASQEEGPRSFKLSDINWIALSSSPVLAEAQIQEIDKKFGHLTGLGIKFFDAFRFEEKPDGGYELFFNPGISGIRTLGKKMVDFEYSMDGFWESVELELLSKAIGQLLNLIPVPVVGALLSTASDRFFHSLDMLYMSRQEMALEMLAQTTESSDQGPWSTLTQPQQEDAIEYIKWSETSILGALKWIFKSPLSQFRDDLSFEREKSIENFKWFASQYSALNYVFQPLNSRFLLARSEKQAGIFLMGTIPFNFYGVITSPDESGPPQALDELNTGAITKQRKWFEVLAATVIFSAELIPNGGILKGAFKKLVERNVNRIKHWESRLLGHFKEREANGENWKSQIRELESQRVNPLDITDSEVESLIRSRKQALGI